MGVEPLAGRRRARPSSARVSSTKYKTSTLLASLILCLDQVDGTAVMTQTASSGPVLRGLASPLSVQQVGLSLAAAESAEGSAVCHNSASFLGVGNTQCLHQNFRTAVFLLAVIVAVSIGVDRLIHLIRGAIKCPQLRLIVNRVFEEIMIMGFLSMVIFTLNTSGAMKSLALNALTSSEQLHFYEFFHYIVFLTMIYFILIVLLLLFIGTVVPKLIWEMKNQSDSRESISDIHEYNDVFEPNNRSFSGSDCGGSGSRRMRHSFIRDVSSLGHDLGCQSTRGSVVEDYERTLDTPSDDAMYTALRTRQRSGSGTYRTMAMRTRALSGMDLVLGSRAYSLLLQRYQREGWGFRFNIRKQWNLWKSFEVLAYNICQNRSGYIYKNPAEMERLFGVRWTPPARTEDNVDSADGVDADNEKSGMTYAKYHVLCMRNLLYHMTNIHPSAFLILLVICLLPAIFPEQDHWIFIGVGGLLLLVNVVIFFKVLKILRGIVDDRLRVITMRDIQKRLEKVLKVSERRGRKKWHGTASASDSTPPSGSVDDSTEEELIPTGENLQNIVQARRKKGSLKFKAAALAVRAVIRMQMSALCHQQLHYHDNRFWFNSPRLLLRLFQFATIGQAFYLVWLSLVEAHSAFDAPVSSGGGSGLLALMGIFPAVALCVITPLTMPSLVLVMSLTGIFVDLNASNGEEEGRRRNVTREEVKTHMRIMRRSFLRSHYTDGESIHMPPATPPAGPMRPSDLAITVGNSEPDTVVSPSPANVFLRIYDSPAASSANARRSKASYYHYNSNSVGRNNGSLGRSNSLGRWLGGHSRSVGSASGSIDDGYGSSRRAFNLAAFQSMGGALPTTGASNNADNEATPQSASSFSSSTCRTPRPTKMVDINNHGGPPTMSWSQADADPDVQLDNNANEDMAQGVDSGQVTSPVSTSFKDYCSKYGGYPDL